MGGAGEAEAGQPLDTFLISIICPHLYIQSSAVEQGGPLVWPSVCTRSQPPSLSCSHSVLAELQECVQLLAKPANAAEQRGISSSALPITPCPLSLFLSLQVREATEEFVAQIQTHRPAQLQTPSLDFSKPRLVQISVTDVGACMPMAPMVCMCVVCSITARPAAPSPSSPTPLTAHRSPSRLWCSPFGKCLCWSISAVKWPAPGTLLASAFASPTSSPCDTRRGPWTPERTRSPTDRKSVV